MHKNNRHACFFHRHFVMSGCALPKKHRLDSMDSDEDDEMESTESKKIEPIKIGHDGDEADEEMDDENDDESKEVADKLQVQQEMYIQEQMPHVLMNILIQQFKPSFFKL